MIHLARSTVIDAVKLMRLLRMKLTIRHGQGDDNDDCERNNTENLQLDGQSWASKQVCPVAMANGAALCRWTGWQMQTTTTTFLLLALRRRLFPRRRRTGRVACRLPDDRCPIMQRSWPAVRTNGCTLICIWFNKNNYCYYCTRSPAKPDCLICLYSVLVVCLCVCARVSFISFL